MQSSKRCTANHRLSKAKGDCLGIVATHVFVPKIGHVSFVKLFSEDFINKPALLVGMIADVVSK